MLYNIVTLLREIPTHFFSNTSLSTDNIMYYLYVPFLIVISISNFERIYFKAIMFRVNQLVS